ncbi:MAG: M20/M25/M40 family metallo-hydrolase [Phycisphaerales bacterium]|nr:M20/M25/M40 family metallo-hydrolase [Phycisphaerales bacterium]MCB9856869.1 M20/M25/M40 family metallo-hydrolase [Phycisphaerales bacterium]MCB9862004.1 M20/M25/M40 family metallo-hydrolase [Phycisphaerales bacterium]
MRRIVRRLAGACLAVALVLTAQPFAAAAERHSTNDSLYSAEQYLGWIDFLASDELEGRGTGEEGIDKAAEYVASIWESFGLQPAGDDNTFYQNFQLALSSRLGNATRLAVGTKGRLTRKPAILNDDYVPLPFSADGSFAGDVVFAGYGISDGDNGYDDYAGIDVKDKVVLILRRGPDFDNFGMQHVSFRAKSLLAKELGAVALLIVNKDGDSHLYDFQRGGRGGDHGIPMVHVTPDFATRMLSAGGLQDIQTLQDRIETNKAPASAPLDGVSVRGHVEIEPVYSDVRNVVGMIPGTGPQKDEMIVLGAHYDHLGVRNKGKADFNPEKDISNGADDNASGTAMLMQMAKTYTRGEAPNRTIVLVAFTGEELGLLGSEHFAKDPTVDLDKCITMLNFDMVGRLKNEMLEVGGMRTGGFEELVRDLAKPYGFDIRDGGGGRGPSDHTNFYLRDIPVLFFFTGLHKQYHRPEDDTPLINADGAMQIARFGSDVIDAIDGNPTPPKFAKDSRRANIGRQKEGDDKPKPDAPLAGPRNTPSDEPVRLGVMPTPTEDGEGLLIDSVSDGSPAGNAGMRPGDRIIRIGTTRIQSIEDAMSALSGLKRGDKTDVQVVRSGQRVTLHVQFGDAPTAAPHVAENPPTKAAAEHAHQHASVEDASHAVCERIEAFARDNSTLRIRSLAHSRSNDGVELRITFSGDPRSAAELDRVSAAIEEVLKSAMGSTATHAEYQIQCEAPGYDKSGFAMTITVRIPRRGSAAPAGPHIGANPNPHAPQAGAATHGSPHERDRANRNPHGDAHRNEPADDVENNTMPPVRLGIMPTYGESEGEGFEIAGVVEGGAAEKGGMKDKDRILSIGGHDVSDVYTYMDALRKCKPGEKIKIFVLRDGKRVELTIVTAPPKVPDDA